MKHFVSEVFIEPKQWGLRGDPFLWEHIKSCYTAVEIPYPTERLKEDILKLFKDAAGELPVRGKHYLMKALPKASTGMSAGYLSADFWLDEAIPLLTERLKRKNQELL